MNNLQKYSSKKSLLISFILLSVILIAQKQYFAAKDKYDSVNAFSAQSSGISSFKILSEKLNSNKIQINQKAFLEEIELKEPPQILMILSPKMPISKKEKGFITNFVNEGGKLFLSAATLDELKLLKGLLVAFHIEDEINENTNFKNYLVEEIESNKDNVFFKKGKKFSFYSPLVFKNQIDSADTNKYFNEYKSGNGSVYLNLGLPLFANGLISMNDNRFFAYNLIEKNQNITVDEYRHMFFEKTYADLISEPTIVLPLLGMLLLVVVFLIFSDTSSVDSSLHDEFVIPNYHKLNSRLAHGIWDKKNLYNQAIEEYRQQLIKYYPNEITKTRTIKSQKDPSKKEFDNTYFQKLLKLHKEILKGRGLS